MIEGCQRLLVNLKEVNNPQPVAVISTQQSSPHPRAVKVLRKQLAHCWPGAGRAAEGVGLGHFTLLPAWGKDAIHETSSWCWTFYLPCSM